MDKKRVLVINPGSTSTKIAVFEGEKPLFTETLRHTAEELAPFGRVADQFAFRKELILKALKKKRIDPATLSAVVGRGGLVKPVESGVYEVNDALRRDLTDAPMGEHASNLGGLIADDIAEGIPGARAFIADPVVVDELDDVARVAGHPAFERVSVFHALNQKAVARIYARSVGKAYEDLNLVVAHLGGGVSVGAHRRGRVVGVHNTLDGGGPFSPRRSGTLPVGQLVDLAFSGKYTREQMRKMIAGQGGVVAHLGTNDMREVRKRAAEGDEKSRLILHALAYNVGKEIGAMAAVLHGEVNAILITGGIAYSTEVCEYIKTMVEFIAPVEVYPGEDEMKALADNALAVIEGKTEPKVYR